LPWAKDEFQQREYWAMLIMTIGLHIYLYIYTLWLFNIAMENHHFLIGKPSINGPFSMAMLNNQRVNII
jgi:hypothetical protein